MADASKTLELLLTSRNATGPGVVSTRAGVVQLGQTVTAQMDRAMGKVLNLRNLIAGGLFGAALHRITSEGDEIKDMSDRLSITAREFQVLSHAMALSGGSAGDVQVAFRTMSNLLYDAGEEGKKAQATMQALGINLASLRGMTPYEQFQALAQALARVTDANTRAAMAQDVFGRGAMQLIPMIKETGGNMDELARKMDVRGQFLSDEQVARADAFRDSLTELNKAVSVAAFEALGETIQSLTKRIMDLVESGELKKWGAEAASTVTALASAVGRVADVIVNHRDGVIALAATYAGLRIVLGALSIFNTIALSVALYTAAQVAAATATNATTAAVAKQTVALEAQAIATWTTGINKASVATKGLAMTVAAATSMLARLGQIGLVAFAGWNIGTVTGKITGLHEAESDLFALMKTRKDIDVIAEGLGGILFPEAPRHPKAKRGPVRISGGAAKSTEKTETPDEQAKREWEALKKTVEAVWTAARIGQQTGDAAAVSVWEKIAGAKGVAEKLTSGDIAAAGARLQAIIRDDADAAVQVLKATSEAEAKAVKEGADEMEKATEKAAEARQKLARMDVEDLRQAALDRVSAIEEAADKEAAALGKAADKKIQAAKAARTAWDNLVAGKSADGKTADERNDEKRQQTAEKRLARRAQAVLARMDEGLYVGQQDTEIANAYLGRQRSAQLEAEAAEARRRQRAMARRAGSAGQARNAMSQGFASADRLAERAGLGRTATGAQGSPGAPAPAPQYQSPVGPGIQVQPPPAMPAMPAGGLESGAIVAELRLHRGLLAQIAYKCGGLG